jgi:ribose-phosphate pyrophosphokinase
VIPPPIIFSSNEHTLIGAELARSIPGATSGGSLERTFPNGEIVVEVQGAVRDRPVIAVVTVTPPASNLVATVSLTDTLKRLGARSIHLVLPYLAYSRHDRGPSERSRMFFLLGKLLAAAGADRISTLDLHHPEIAPEFGLPLETVSTVPLFKARLTGSPFEHGVILAPDEGARHRAEELAQALRFERPILSGVKRRSFSGISTEFPPCPASSVIIIDDILDTGETLIAAAEHLARHGVTRTIVCVSHGLFTGSRWSHLWELGIERIYTTDSVGGGHIPDDRRIEIIPCASIISESIGRSFFKDSVCAHPHPKR